MTGLSAAFYVDLAAAAEATSPRDIIDALTALRASVDDLIDDAYQSDDTLATVAAVADLYEVDRAALLNTPAHDTDALLRARQMIGWVLLRRYHNPRDVGRLLDRDHSTIRAAARRIDADPARRSLAATVLDSIDAAHGRPKVPA